MNKAFCFAAGLAVCVMGAGMAYAQGAAQVVADGMKVTFDYTLTVEGAGRDHPGQEAARIRPGPEDAYPWP